ncbi:hypothetical protein [Burkholderia ubonensis]|uniref:hypothetical protein n=1 Tax=Burkholderia ubonensis TaxID=101571 RepID=UPI001E5F2576|nr:hypothetical protein [Burkholderia ubonensis]
MSDSLALFGTCAHTVSPGGFGRANIKWLMWFVRVHRSAVFPGKVSTFPDCLQLANTNLVDGVNEIVNVIKRPD